MARKRSVEPKAPESAPEPPATAPNQNILTIRGKKAWKDWLERYAEFRRTKPTGMIDIALFEAAQRDRFELPPPRL